MAPSFRSPAVSSALLAFVCAWAAPSAADDDPDRAICLDAFTQTQALRNAGKLVAAREQALVCSREQCGEVINTKCKTWQREIDDITPTIAIRVIAETGSDTADAVLFIDGVQVKQRLDGLPVTLDPGEHVLRVERAEHGSREARIVLNVGDKTREVVLSFEPAVAPAPPPDPARPPVESSVHPLTYVGFGLAGAGVIVGAVVGGVSMMKAAELRELCPENRCTEAERDLHDEMTLLSHTATVSFAVAGAGAILGAVGLFVLSEGLFGGDGVAVLIGPAALSVRVRF